MFQGVHFGGIVVADRVIHEAADGKRFLVIHGDQFDAVVHNARWLAYLGDFAYDAAMALNRVVARVRRSCGMPYWSFSSWAKVKVKKAVNFIGSFQQVLTEEARRSEVDGVICGHIHHAGDRELRRHRLHQHRRLGGELHGGGRSISTALWTSCAGRM